MATTKTIRKALYTAITGASSVTNLLASSTAVYHGVAPAEANLPFIILQKQAGNPTYALQGRAWDNQVWMIKAVTRDTTSDTAEDIQAALDTLLTRSTLTISGGSLLSIFRESDMDYLETDGDQTYRHHGSLYRLRVT